MANLSIERKIITIQKWFKLYARKPLLIAALLLLILQTGTLTFFYAKQLDTWNDVIEQVATTVSLGVRQNNRTLIENTLSLVRDQSSARRVMLCEGRQPIIALPQSTDSCEFENSGMRFRIYKTKLANQGDLLVMAEFDLMSSMKPLVIFIAISLFFLGVASFILWRTQNKLHSDIVSPLTVPIENIVDLERPLKPFVTKEISELFQSLREKITTIQELNETQKKLERQAAISGITQMLAHDVRRPFSLINGILNSLRSAPPTKVAEFCQEYIPEVQRSLNHVNSMLADILDTGSSFSLDKRVVDLRSLIREAIDESNGSDPSRGISIDCNFEHGSQVLIDPTKVLRVLSNIIGNAFQATAKMGSISIATQEDDDWVTVSIMNSGSYILPEHQVKVFETFFTRGKKNGSGLGLAIAKKIVEAHGGAIWCNSDKDNGTEFTFTIPKQKELAPGDDYYIVVDDSPLNRYLWSNVKDLGTVRVFSNPAEFWREVSNDLNLLLEVNGIITDYYFDEDSETGLTFAEALRSKGYQGRLYLCTDAEFDSSGLTCIKAKKISKDPGQAVAEILGDIVDEDVLS
jgi:signal transduction histidine kinase